MSRTDMDRELFGYTPRRASRRRKVLSLSLSLAACVVLAIPVFALAVRFDIPAGTQAFARDSLYTAQTALSLRFDRVSEGVAAAVSGAGRVAESGLPVRGTQTGADALSGLLERVRLLARGAQASSQSGGLHAAWKVPPQVQEFSERIRELLAGLSFSPAARAEPASNPQPGDEPPSQSPPSAAPPGEAHSLWAAPGDVAADIERGAADLSKKVSLAAAAALDAPAHFSGFLRSLFSRFLPDRDLVYVAPPQPDQPSQATPATAKLSRPTTTTVIYQTVTQPVIERVIEASPGLAIMQSGVTEDFLAAKLQELTTSLNARIQNAFIGAAQTARVENLSAITVSGVSGLTDADIPDDITASNYLALTGGTLSGTLAGTNLTLSGDLTVSGAQTLSGAITIPYLTATSSIASSFIQASTTRLSVFDRAYFGGSATSTFDSAGNLSVAGTIAATGGLSTLSNLLLSGSTTLRDFTFGNATGTAATTTSFFSTTASSTNLFTSNFSIGSLTGFLKATAGAVAVALIDLANDVTGILPVGNGGTGWSNIVSGTLLTGNGSNALSTTTVGNGLSLSGGVLSTSFGTTTANTWTALQSFTLGASTTQLSALDALYVGRTATTTIRGDGVASSLPYASSTALTVSGTGYFGTASTTNLTVSSLTQNRIPYIAAAGAFTDASSFTFDGTVLTLPQLLATASTTLQNFTFVNATGTAATTTNFAITSILSSLLKTDSSGNVIPAVSGSDYLTSADVASYPFTTTTHFGTTTSATSTPLFLRGSQYALFASSTSVFTNASTTQLTIGTDFVTSVSGDALELTAAGILNINDVTAAMLAAADFGDFSCGGVTCTFDADTVGTAEFADEDWGDLTAAAGVVSIDEDVIEVANIANGNWGDFTITTNVASLDADVVGDSELDYSQVTLADFSNDADYVKWANATTSLWQTSGLLSTASSTIGAGGQATGLTISGGATTTGSLAITGTTGTTTIASGQGFTVGDSQFVVQQGSGNVGIGTTVPRGKLHVEHGNSYAYFRSSGSGGTVFGATDTIPIVTGSGFVGYGGIGIIPDRWGNATVVDTHTAMYLGGAQRNTNAIAASLVFANWGYFTNTGATAGGLGNATAQGDAVKFKFELHDAGGEFTQRLDLYSRSASAVNTAVLSALSNGSVGIAMTNPSVALDVTGSIEYTGTITDVSDERLKENITPIAQNLEKLRQLNPVSFNMIGATSTQLGFLAQNVQAFFPDAVSVVDPVNGYLGLDYTQLIAPAIGAIQELNLNLEALASTTASSTPQSQSFATSFFSNLFSRLTRWFADAGNGIADFFAKRVRTDELCVGATCVDESELQQLLDLRSQSAAAGRASTPAPAPEPSLAPESEPPPQPAPAEEEAPTPPTSDESRQLEAVEVSTESAGSEPPAEEDAEREIAAELPETDAPSIAPEEIAETADESPDDATQVEPESSDVPAQEPAPELQASEDSVLIEGASAE
ncbi:hypothetical protein A2765_05485 [Candidatus Kaiserbacteria bacterium RIFCSPHIGHO2_01_FULL_56_24]|uniref:Peptidase S74 domain-containing protein n=1 Tax=Candidatus Kaiserbacteria bacterium RIFCSPHIGHO2_01_FULL_56_24 TaxID=1798487 RepID=A0A1F6DBH4_9BACT|nr:MAG: hypothetical protein A2765_05485 [Candidatus Kaiserbacteria bacterium RIFCSPHIGHO2_01_FULL_56_24]